MEQMSVTGRVQITICRALQHKQADELLAVRSFEIQNCRIVAAPEPFHSDGTFKLWCRLDGDRQQSGRTELSSCCTGKAMIRSQLYFSSTTAICFRPVFVW
jgi:hypothetical protein